MDNNNPYERQRKSKVELYQEKLQKRSETQDWIFGNTFGKPGSGAPLRDSKGNVVSNLKSITDGNIYKYDPNAFSKGNNDVSVINHKVLNISNNNDTNNLLINNNIINYNNQIQNNLNSNKNNNIIMSYNIKQLKNNNINNENQKENNKLINNNNTGNNIGYFSNLNSPNFTLPNYPYNLFLPQPSININSLSMNIPYNNTQLLNNTNIYSQQYKNNNYNFNQNVYNSLNNIKNIQNINSSYFGNESRKKEEQKNIEREEYRNELLLQITEKKKRDEERKRKMEEEEKIQDMNNEEYYRLKQLQAEEQARKLRERIKRRMQRSSNDEYGSSSNIQEISKDFQNVNKSNEGESPLNNNIEEQKDNEENILMNDEENIYGGNMLIEQENYMKKIDDDYQILRQSLNNDIDKQINYNIISNYNHIINNNIFNNDKLTAKLFMKENQLADYILGTNNSPPTPIKTSDYNNNILSHSYSQKRRMYIKDYPNLLNIKNDKDIDNYNILRSKTFNLDDFFNKDEKKKDNANNVKESIKTKEAQDKVEKDYESIFKDLKKAHEYTKKYSVIDEDDIPENTTSSFITNNTNKNTTSKYKNQIQYNTKYNTKYNSSYYLNSSAAFTNYDRNENKNINEKNKDKISENEMVDENSVRTTGIKNVSKTVLDKVLLNIQENKEDEEDEEDDEQNQKIKQEINAENHAIKENEEEEKNNDIKNEEENENDDGENGEKDENDEEENEEEENVEEQ